jgi:hypothetical protein
MKCSYCGQETDENEQFCSNCGMKFSEAPPTPESDQIRCEKCGFLNPRGADVCGDCGQTLAESEPQPDTCPSCGFGHNPPDAQFCIKCGVRLSPPESIPEPAAVCKAAFVLSDTAEIELRDQEMIIGRKDFLQKVSPEEAKYISREHVKIICEDGTFFIIDEASSNGTTLNGIQIKGQGKKELHHDDEIILADTVTVHFKTYS